MSIWRGCSSRGACRSCLGNPLQCSAAELSTGLSATRRCDRHSGDCCPAVPTITQQGRSSNIKVGVAVPRQHAHGRARIVDHTVHHSSGTTAQRDCICTPVGGILSRDAQIKAQARHRRAPHHLLDSRLCPAHCFRCGVGKRRTAQLGSRVRSIKALI